MFGTAKYNLCRLKSAMSLRDLLFCIVSPFAIVVDNNVSILIFDSSSIPSQIMLFGNETCSRIEIK